MRFKKFLRALRRFFRRFNPWLYIVCLLLARAIWCAAMYSKDPDGLRPDETEDPVACLATEYTPV